MSEARSASDVKSPRSSRGKSESRTNDPDRTRADIVSVAIREFSQKGLSGARVDEIAARTRTSKRMIYYYFGNKEGLYCAALEECYDGIRTIEENLDLDTPEPEEALRSLVKSTFDYHNENPDFVRLVMNENIHHGSHIDHLKNIKERNRSVIELLQNLIERGTIMGVFRKDIDPIELHMSISALCFYNVSNRHTFSRIFERDMTSRQAVEARREVVVDMILRWCCVK